MKAIRLLHFDFPAKLGGQKVCLMHEALYIHALLYLQKNFVTVLK